MRDRMRQEWEMSRARAEAFAAEVEGKVCGCGDEAIGRLLIFKSPGRHIDPAEPEEWWLCWPCFQRFHAKAMVQLGVGACEHEVGACHSIN